MGYSVDHEGPSVTRSVTCYAHGSRTTLGRLRPMASLIGPSVVRPAAVVYREVLV
jgi:hypothetical protein